MLLAAANDLGVMNRWVLRAAGLSRLGRAVQDTLILKNPPYNQ
jgi:hypothetical protein